MGLLPQLSELYVEKGDPVEFLLYGKAKGSFQGRGEGVGRVSAGL